jgi:hypothetical protein
VPESLFGRLERGRLYELEADFEGIGVLRTIHRAGSRYVEFSSRPGKPLVVGKTYIVRPARVRYFGEEGVRVRAVPLKGREKRAKFELWAKKREALSVREPGIYVLELVGPNGTKRSMFATYQGSKQWQVCVSEPGEYRILSAKRYTLEDFCRDVEGKLPGKLALDVRNGSVSARINGAFLPVSKSKFGTYGGYAYVELTITDGEKSATIRVHRYGDGGVVAYRTDLGSYLRVIDAYLVGGKAVIECERPGRISSRFVLELPGLVEAFVLEPEEIISLSELPREGPYGAAVYTVAVTESALKKMKTHIARPI